MALRRHTRALGRQPVAQSVAIQKPCRSFIFA